MFHNVQRTCIVILHLVQTHYSEEHLIRNGHDSRIKERKKRKKHPQRGGLLKMNV